MQVADSVLDQQLVYDLSSLPVRDLIGQKRAYSSES